VKCTVEMRPKSYAVFLQSHKNYRCMQVEVVEEEVVVVVEEEVVEVKTEGKKRYTTLVVSEKTHTHTHTYGTLVKKTTTTTTTTTTAGVRVSRETRNSRSAGGQGASWGTRCTGCPLVAGRGK